MFGEAVSLLAYYFYYKPVDLIYCTRTGAATLPKNINLKIILFVTPARYSSNRITLKIENKGNDMALESTPLKAEIYVWIVTRSRFKL